MSSNVATEPLRDLARARDAVCAVAPSLLLTLCTIAGLRGLQATGLAVTHAWSLSPSHLVKDALLLFPSALATVAAAVRLAKGWAVPRPTLKGLLGAAALIAAAFGLLLTPLLGLHHYLAHALDSGVPAHSFHGRTPAGSAGAILWNLLEGLHDALLVSIATVPTMLLGLSVLVARNRPRTTPSPGLATLGALCRAAGAGCVVSIALAAGAAAVTLALSLDPYLHGATHGALAASRPVGIEAKIGDVRVAVQSAIWLQQPRRSGQPDAARSGVPNAQASVDRVYLNIRIKNVGAGPRRIGRRDFRLRGPDAAWGPLGGDFPDFVLAPQEQLRTRLIFEVPQRPVELEFAWDEGTPRVRIPLADDVPESFFLAVCRGILSDPKWN